MGRFSGAHPAHELGSAVVAFWQRAASSAACTSASDDLPCRLASVQGLLDTLAVLLAVVLAIAVGVALRVWLRQRATERREEGRRGPDRVIR